jgi:hypothetical protein
VAVDVLMNLVYRIARATVAPATVARAGQSAWKAQAAELLGVGKATVYRFSRGDFCEAPPPFGPRSFPRQKSKDS